MSTSERCKDSDASDAGRYQSAHTSATLRKVARRNGRWSWLLCMSSLLLVTSVACASGPVATVRVAFDRHGITSVQTHGLADKATGRKVTANDPVVVASISKMVTAVGVMRLVQAGKLNLDADVSTYLGWKLRNSKFPDIPITLRLLMSHRSSLTDDAGYWQTPLGGQLRNILQNPRAWDPKHKPGTYFHYTNLNYPVVAQVMERVTGTRFDLLMQHLVLKPLAIDGCFSWATCSDAAAARAIVVYGEDGKPLVDDHHGLKPACPVRRARDGSCDLSRYRPGENGAQFGPQGGLRISAIGLAHVGMMLLNNGTFALNGAHLLTPESVKTMTTSEWKYDGRNGLTYEEDEDPDGVELGLFCHWGIGMQILATQASGCHDDPFGDGIARVGHSGSIDGLQTGIWLDRNRGTGVAWIATGMPPVRKGGSRSAFSAVEETMAHRD